MTCMERYFGSHAKDLKLRSQCHWSGKGFTLSPWWGENHSFITTKSWWIYPTSHASTLIKFCRNSVNIFFYLFIFFFLKFRMCFFTIKETFGHFHQNVGLIDICLDAGPTIWPLIFDPIHDFDLGFWRSNFDTAVYVRYGWFEWCEMKWK